MRILVMGASQGTGARAVETALARGHHVTAFARTPGRLADHEGLRRLVGDFHRDDSVAPAVAGHDAVVITASATKLAAFKENPHYFSQGTAYVIAAMKACGVKRLVVLSAFGVGDSLPLLNPVVRLLGPGWLLKVPFADHEVQEQMVRDSGLDWVLARPTRLTDGPAKHRYRKETGLVRVPSSISRADVADFLVTACEDPAWDGHAVHLGG